MTRGDWDTFSVNMPPEDMKRFDEHCSTRSGTTRLILKTWMDVVEEYDIDEDMEQIQLAVLSAYRNSVDKNIQTMKVQRDKLDSAIDDLKDEDDNDVLFEIDFTLKRERL